jgi:hypothetical protein
MYFFLETVYILIEQLFLWLKSDCMYGKCTEMAFLSTERKVEIDIFNSPNTLKELRDSD